MRTPGRTKLAAWMRRTRVTQTMLAQRLGLSQSCVSKWLSGLARPSDEHREELRALAGVDPDEWRTKREVERAAFAGGAAA